MYHFIEDKKFLDKMRTICSDIVNQLVQLINKENCLEVKAHLVGSGAKNFITQNGEMPIDLDYILIIKNSNLKTPKEIKEYVRKRFNLILEKNNWRNCQDSTSVLTTPKKSFFEWSTKFSIDLAIICKNREGNNCCLIHKKTGNTKNDRWFWNETLTKFEDLDSKTKVLKERNCWIQVREKYLEKKNMYLRQNDYNHPSYICYMEAVNEIYNRKKFW